MRRRQAAGLALLIGVLWLLAGGAVRSDEPTKAPGSDKPPWQRLLQGEDAKKAAEREQQLDELLATGKFEDAVKVAEAVAELRAKAQGKDHWEAVNARREVEAIRRVFGQGQEVRDEYAGSFAVQAQADTLVNAGRYKDAQPLDEKVLAVRRKVLGEEHPHTATSYNNVAANLQAQGKYAAAEGDWLHAADCFAKARLRIAPSGLDRAAKTGEQSPLPRLAAVLARNGKLEGAWQRFEQGLARGTWDDLSARLSRPPAEQAEQAELVARLDRLDRLIEKAVAVKDPTPEQDQQRKDLLTQRRKAQDELDAFAGHLEKTYGPAAGQVFDRATIQKALPNDTALVAWLDIPGAPKAADPNGEHWAVVLRSAGPAAWVRLRGSGPKDAWTEDDSRLSADLRAALQSSKGDWQPLAGRLRKQRWEPLAKYLAAADPLPSVRHVIALPSPDLKGVPVEVFADGCTVSYALSGTLHAHLRQQPKVNTKGLFALADPVFDSPALADKPLPLPKGGVLLTVVVPGGNAAAADLRPNDVLLRYNETDLASRADLKPLLESNDPEKRVAVTVWRDGKTFERQLRPGKLGVVIADDPAPKALAELRRLDKRLATRGGDDKWEQLPGTRAEVEALRRLFPDESKPKLLFDSEASEQQLYDLAKDGALGQYRYLHLATHGEVDDRFPLRSALILSRDALPDPGKQLDAGLPVFDGRLTADKVLRQWHLKSELVTLSACQTALGKYERGEGFVGFAQALILAGSRSVCLSQWKVDDAATALLMDRFYQNLLGQREGFKGPLPKAQALAEAKEWLRTLSREEALKRAVQLTKGVERGKGRPVQPLLPDVPVAADKGDRPYAHPYYWAAFVLIGDPD